MSKNSKFRATPSASNAAGKKTTGLEEPARRGNLEWFERLARLLASFRSQGPASFRGPYALARLVEAGHFLRYTVAPDEAMAYLKALLGSRERLVAEDDRLCLRRLAAAALPEIRKRALPQKPSGTQYVLTIYEERRLTRAYRGLVRFFGARKQPDPTLQEVNTQLAEFYPSRSYEDAKLEQGPADARPERSTPDGVRPEARCETAASSKPPVSLVPPVSRILEGSPETSAKSGTTTQGRLPFGLPGVPADRTVAAPSWTAINSAVFTTQRPETVERPSTLGSRILEGSWSSTPQDAARPQPMGLHTWKELLPLLRGLRASVQRLGDLPSPGRAPSVSDRASKMVALGDSGGRPSWADFPRSQALGRAEHDPRRRERARRHVDLRAPERRDLPPVQHHVRRRSAAGTDSHADIRSRPRSERRTELSVSGIESLLKSVRL